MGVNHNGLEFLNFQNEPDIRIWRYMDFTKFVSILDSNSLYLSRVDLLGDPFEGSYPKQLIESREVILKALGEDILNLNIPVNSEKMSFIEYISYIIAWSRKWTYVNCWHMNEHESAALWKLYSSSNDAIAIQSRYKLLKENMPSETLIGKVVYIDYSSTNIPEYSYFWPNFYKRISFSHERELRAIIREYPIENGAAAIGKDNAALGKYVPVNIHNLIENIYVAPSSSGWFKQLVENVMCKYGIEKALSRSSLESECYP